MNPEALDRFVGQQRILRSLRPELEAALAIRRPPPNIVLHGPPGLGKSKLVEAIRDFLGAKLVSAKGNDIRQNKNFQWHRLLMQFGPPPWPELDSNWRIAHPELLTYRILHVDECEAVPACVWQQLHDALQPGPQGQQSYTWQIPQGPLVRACSPPFSVILATNYFYEVQERSPATLSRFELQYRFDYYSLDELTALLMQQAEDFGLMLDPKAAGAIAARSKGVPRHGVQFLLRANRRRTLDGQDVVMPKHVLAVMKDEGIEDDGLTPLDLKTLTTIFNARGSAIGQRNLAYQLGLSEKEMSLVEPYLQHRGFLDVCSTGRTLTRDGLQRIGHLVGISVQG